MLISEVETERYYWQKHYVTPVRAPKRRIAPKLMPGSNGLWRKPMVGYEWLPPMRSFPGMSVLCRVLVDYIEGRTIHIVRLEWRMDELRRWRLWGIPDTTTAAKLVRPVETEGA